MNDKTEWKAKVHSWIEYQEDNYQADIKRLSECFSDDIVESLKHASEIKEILSWANAIKRPYHDRFSQLRPLKREDGERLFKTLEEYRAFVIDYYVVNAWQHNRSTSAEAIGYVLRSLDSLTEKS